MALSRRNGPRFEIELWRREGGAWRTTALTAGSDSDNVRPVFERGGRRVLWMTGGYDDYLHFRTGVRIGGD